MAEENILFVQRKGLIDELVEFNNNESNRICSLDGEWGSGKSFFIDKFINQKKCAVEDEEETEKIRNTDMNFDIIKFDAWENQGNENINMIFLEAIYEELNLREYEDQPFLDYIKNHYKELIGKTSKGLLKLFTPQIVGEVIDVTSEAYREFKNKLLYEIFENNILEQMIDEKDFYKIMINVLIKENKTLIIIDELDRCEPKFAMNVIKKIIYLNKEMKAENKKVNFLISINKFQFANMLTGYYGNDYDTHQYFDKIFDYEFKLPEAESKYDYLIGFLTKTAGIIFDSATFKKMNFKTTDAFESLSYRKLNLLAERLNNSKDLDGDDLSKHIDKIKFIELVIEIVKLYNYKEFINIKNAVRKLRKYPSYEIYENFDGIEFKAKPRNKTQLFDDLEIVRAYFKREDVVELEPRDYGGLSMNDRDKLSYSFSEEVLLLISKYPI